MDYADFLAQKAITAAPLTTDEQAELAQHEATIEHGLQTFYAVGSALATIRDERLYRAAHRTFEEYCQERWGMTPQHAGRLVRAAMTVAQLEPTGSVLPETERHIRPLTRLAPDQQPAAWQKAIETAPNGKITAAHVEQVVEAWGRQKPKTNRAGDLYEPRGFDACQTPGYAIDPLLPYLPMDWTIWEPACGEGLLIEAFYDASRNVVGSDILSGDNFFMTEPDTWDCLVTNPPYSIKYQWLERCYQLRKPFALLLPIETLGAKQAQALFIEHGVQIILLDRRINFKMPNIGWEGSSAQFPVAWFTWGLDLETQIVFARLHETD